MRALRAATERIVTTGFHRADLAREAGEQVNLLRTRMQEEQTTTEDVEDRGVAARVGEKMNAREGIVTEVDVGIITALPEERDAILALLPDLVRVTYEQHDTRTYYRGSLPTHSRGSYEVALTMLPVMGNVEAALSSSDLIRLWRPRAVLMVGIAAGISQQTQRFGDIVVAERINYYEPAKLVAGSRQDRPQVFTCDRQLYDRACNLPGSSWWLESSAPPAVHFGPIASGEKVIADAAALERLRKLQPKLVAIEMESAGVAAAALSSARRIAFLTIRAISDFADASKDDSWHVAAAQHAANFAVGFLRSGPLEAKAVRAPVAPRQTSAIDRSMLLATISKRLDLSRHSRNQTG